MTSDSLRRLLEAATPLPWEAIGDGVWGDDGWVLTDAFDANAALIVAAVNSLPALLDIVDAAKTLYDEGETAKTIGALGAALARLEKQP